MKLDDLARRAADEMREAGRAARFTVRVPEAGRPGPGGGGLRRRSRRASRGIPLLLLYGPWVKPITVPVTTSTIATTTTSTTDGCDDDRDCVDHHDGGGQDAVR